MNPPCRSEKGMKTGKVAIGIGIGIAIGIFEAKNR
jgi:hypothetical protein